MATGVSKREQLGMNTITAAQPHRDPHPLPQPGSEAVLTYPGRLSPDEAVRPIQTSFVHLAADGSRRAAAAIEDGKQGEGEDGDKATHKVLMSLKKSVAMVKHCRPCASVP